MRLKNRVKAQMRLNTGLCNGCGDCGYGIMIELVSVNNGVCDGCGEREFFTIRFR